MGRFIVNCEARRDSKGRIKIYKLPASDGGGSYEIAGINDRYHPKEAAGLAQLIREGQHEAAEITAQMHILNYTDVVRSWHPSLAVQAFLRDTAFNRGPGGAAKVLQMACEVEVDGKVGPVTKAAAAAHTAREMLLALRVTREAYERRIAPPVGARAKFWKGLVARWDKALEFAKRML